MVTSLGVVGNEVSFQPTSLSLLRKTDQFADTPRSPYTDSTIRAIGSEEPRRRELLGEQIDQLGERLARRFARRPQMRPLLARAEEVTGIRLVISHKPTHVPFSR